LTQINFLQVIDGGKQPTEADARSGPKVIKLLNVCYLQMFAVRLEKLARDKCSKS
jgi:hypothetical protein